MSSRIKTKYETDDGDVFPIWLSPETVAVAGNTVAGTVTNARHTIKVSTSGRSPMLSPRRLVIKKVLGTVGAAPNQRTVYQTARVVITSVATLNTLAAAESVQYKGSAWEVIAVESER